MKHKVLSAGRAIGILIATFMMAACSDSTPAITAVEGITVLDYADSNLHPTVRLSLFASADEIQRVKELRAVNEQTGLVWTINSPRLLFGRNNISWAGYTNLVAASGQSLPMGKYTIIYEDAAERECEGALFVSYPKELLDKIPSDFPSAIKGQYIENIALYSVDGSLLYYGKRKDVWTGEQMIKRDFMMAASMRTCYALNNNTVVCMMPMKKFAESGGGSEVTVDADSEH